MTVMVPVQEENPVEVTSKPKLSELMRYGAQVVGKQSRFRMVYYKRSNPEEISSVCALGAVVVGAGAAPSTTWHQNWNARLSDLMRNLFGNDPVRIPGHPLCQTEPVSNRIYTCRRQQRSGDSVQGVVIHLNDDHRMPIREIADYLQSQGY